MLLTIGEIELVSYPYAMVAQTAISVAGVNLANAKDGDILKYNATTKTWGPVSGAYSAGKGIQISNDSIINTSQNTPVNITGTGGTTVTGTYPNFTVNSLAYKAFNNLKISGDTISGSLDFDTTRAISAQSYQSSNTYGSLMTDTGNYALATSSGIYYVTGRATVANYDAYSSAVGYVSIYNRTQGTNIKEANISLSQSSYTAVHNDFHLFVYLNKGDKLCLGYSISYSASFYYNYPGDYVNIIKVK